MPTRNWSNWQNKGPYIGNVAVEVYDSTWTNSPRNPRTKQLILQSNAYSLDHRRNKSYQYDGKGASTPPISLSAGANAAAASAYNSAYAEAYARLRGKLYKGSAQLGVTAGSYAQSREMIVNRSRSITEQAADILSDVGKRYQVRGRLAKRAADSILEVMFGWQPLVVDIHNAALEVVQLADSRQSVNGRGRRSYQSANSASSSDGKRTTRDQLFGTCSVSVATLVTISNHNRWLLERFGVLNPAAVAWDLIPWSFLVNMIANTGGLVNSITDFAGLTFGNASTTRTYHESGSAANSYRDSGTFPFPWATNSSFTSSWISRRKIRALEGVPRPSLVMKIPDANWELAAIASSLMVQQVYGVGGLVRRLQSAGYTE